MSENEARPPVVNQRPRKPARGLLGQVSAIIFQPAKFFAEMPTTQYNRQWAWIGLILLIIIGLNVVQQYEADNGSSSESGITDPMMGGFEGGMDSGFMGDPFMGSDMGGMDGGSSGGEGAVNTSTKWEMALVAAAGMVFVWFMQMLVLSQVSLFKGQAPIWSDNLQIAIWAGVPLGLMALFQMFFRWTGGEIGETGLSGLIVQLPLYQSANPFLQDLLKTFASHLTLFWVWSLFLIYVGSRHVLHGQLLPSIFAVVMWAVLFVAVPPLINLANGDDTPPVMSDDEFGGEDDFFMPDGEFEGFPNEEINPFDEFNGDGFTEGEFSDEDNFSNDEELPLDEELTPDSQADLGAEEFDPDPEATEEALFEDEMPPTEEAPMTDEARK